MANGTIFPAFIRLQVDNDGSARSDFVRAVDNMATAGEQRFREFSAEAKRQVDSAVSAMSKGGSGVDIGAGAAQANAAAARARAAAAREIANATAIAAKEAGDYSQQTRLAIAASQALAKEEEQAAASALSHARALEQVETVLARQTGAMASTASATGRLMAANDNFVTSTGQQRAGLQQLGLQLNDIATMYSLGARPAQIFASQIGQVTQAVQLMAGGTSRLAGFLGGPWGIALSTAVIALSPLIGKLFETKSVTDEVTFSASKLGDAQIVLGAVIDITTGKINNQSTALMALARAQALAGQISARRQMADARETMGDMSTGLLRRLGMTGDRNLPGQGGLQGDILEAFQAGSMSATEAERGLRSLVNTGLITEKVYLDAAKALTDFAVAAENLKTFEGAERLLTGNGTAADRASLLKPDARKRLGRNGGVSAARGTDIVGDLGARLAQLRDQFTDIPPAVQQSNRATAQLDGIIRDINVKLSDTKGLSAEQRDEMVRMKAAAESLKPAVEAAMVKPFNDFVKGTAERARIDNLVLAGLENEAELMRVILGLEKQQKPLDEAQRDTVRDILAAERQRAEAMERQQTLTGAYLDATRSVRSELEAILAGQGKISNFKPIFRQLSSKILTEQLFGDALRGLENFVKRDAFSPAVDNLTQQTGRASDAISGLADVAATVRDQIAGQGSVTGSLAGTSVASAPSLAVNDNDPSLIDGNDITVRPKPIGPRDPNKVALKEALRTSGTAFALRPADFAQMMGKSIAGPITAALDDLLGTSFFARMQGILGSALGGYATGGATGGILGALKGINDTFGGQMFGDVLSKSIGKGLNGALQGAQTGTMTAGVMKMLGIKTSTTGAQIGGALGSFAGPVGSIVGSIAGGLLGGLFKKTKYGTATIGAVNGGLGIVGTRGNSGSRKDAASELSGSVLESIDRIAEQLGAEVDPSRGSVSVGMYKKKWRVSTTGFQGKLDFKGSSANGLLDFGEDQAAAMRAATLDLVKDGVLQGLRAGTQTLLRNSKDLEAGIQKALDFESVFSRLKAYKDPVGAALDTLDKEFKRFAGIFKEAGASAAEFAQLEQLYGIERAQAVKEAAERYTSSLKGLLDDLTIGDSGLSLRDRQANARAQFDPLAARVAAGDVTAFDGYSEAARTLLELTREIEGSQQGYFDLFDQVRGATSKAIADQTNVAMISQNRDSPFSGSSIPIADNAGTVAAINSQTTDLGAKLDALNQNVGTLIRQGAAGFKGAAQPATWWQPAGNW